MAKTNDDHILDERIQANKLNYPRHILVLVALVVSFQPAYFSHAINAMDATSPTNAVLYAAVTGFCTYLLTQAYGVMISSEFWVRQRHFSEVTDQEGKALRRLRLQVSMAYSLFFLNSIFFVLTTSLMAYLFRHSDPRASYTLSPTLSAALLWLLAQKNEESRQKRLRRHK